MSVEDLAKAKSGRPKFLSSAAFLGDFEPPEYLIDGILLRGYLYSLTAPTGHGKTAVALLAAFMLDTGREYLAGKPVKRGKVVYLAVENPLDVKMRAILMASQWGLRYEDMGIRWVGGAFDLKAGLAEVEANASDAALIIIDTGAAFALENGFGEENDNSGQLEFAKRLRAMTAFESRPTVLALMHPIKHASCKEQCLPRGGGSFIAEVDGNLTLWAEGDRRVAELHWTGKFRGPPFDPIPFALETGTCPELVTAEGREISTVSARTISDFEARQRTEQEETDERSLTMAMALHPGASMRQLAEHLGWRSKNDQLLHSKVERTLKNLAKEKLAKKLGRHWELTADGRRVLDREQPRGHDPAAGLKAKFKVVE